MSIARGTAPANKQGDSVRAWGEYIGNLGLGITRALASRLRDYRAQL